MQELCGTGCAPDSCSFSWKKDDPAGADSSDAKCRCSKCKTAEVADGPFPNCDKGEDLEYGPNVCDYEKWQEECGADCATHDDCVWSWPIDDPNKDVSLKPRCACKKCKGETILDIFADFIQP